MNSHEDGAQGRLEQQALRNVRGLLDKLENEDRQQATNTWRLALLTLGILAVVCIGSVIAVLAFSAPDKSYAGTSSSQALRDECEERAFVEWATRAGHRFEVLPVTDAMGYRTGGRLFLLRFTAEEVASNGGQLWNGAPKGVACPSSPPSGAVRTAAPLEPVALRATGAVIAEKILVGRKRLGVPKELAGKGGAVDLEAIIRPDGSLEKLTVVATSGDPGLDAYAVKAIESSAPFGPLPTSVIAKNEAFKFPMRIQFQPERER